LALAARVNPDAMKASIAMRAFKATEMPWRQPARGG
jgi:hypothetical protein